MQTEKIYGNLPKVIGSCKIPTDEMMFWLYCPVKLAKQEDACVPANLQKYYPLIEAVRRDIGENDWYNKFIYITAKTLFVTPENPGNRPGWHSDGFLTDDLNFVWYDSNPTVFFCDFNEYSFTADHVKSLDEMDKLCEGDTRSHCRFKPYELLKLDQTVLHKVDTNIEAGVRTFVKISVSDKPYALKGNSVNHLIHYDWKMNERGVDRNCPIGEK